jgi:hypothetical protein
MSDHEMNDHILTKECEALAKEIFDIALEDMAEDETPEDYADDMQDRAHEYADGHQWVIYYHWAHRICMYCNTDDGEQFLEDIGMPETPTYDGLATIIAFGEMRARISAALADLVDGWEAA